MSYLKHLLVSKGWRTAWERGMAIARQLGPTETRMARTLTAYLNLLADFDVRPTFPTPATVVARHPRLIAYLHAQGAEIAIHGDVHVDMQALSPEEQRRHIRQAVARFRAHGLPVHGFRAPYLRWNPTLLEALREINVYDSSLAVYWDAVPTLDTFAHQRMRRVLLFYGAQTLSPWPLYPVQQQGVLRLPVSLPDDEMLVDRLGWRDSAAIAGVWHHMLTTTHRQGGLLVLQLHPERFFTCADALRQVLIAARTLRPPVWITTMQAVAAWWQARAQAVVKVQPTNGGWHITVEGLANASLLVNATLPPGHERWDDHWYHVPGPEVTLYSPRRPTIGVTGQVPQAGVEALRAAGYIVEPATGQQALVLDTPTWTPAVQAEVWHRVHTHVSPLVRIAPWPDGARCALCITGDLDAVTWWDFLSRLARG